MEQGASGNVVELRVELPAGLSVTALRELLAMHGVALRAWRNGMAQVEYELRAAEGLFRRYGIPYINTTECSIEEIASRILDKTGVERRLRP